MKLEKINLKKGNGHYHPDIKTGRVLYLAKIHNSWFIGTFDMQWYGLNFQGCDIQFDTPGTNASEWQELYRLVR